MRHEWRSQLRKRDLGPKHHGQSPNCAVKSEVSLSKSRYLEEVPGHLLEPSLRQRQQQWPLEKGGDCTPPGVATASFVPGGFKYGGRNNWVCIINIG